MLLLSSEKEVGSSSASYVKVCHFFKVVTEKNATLSNSKSKSV